MLKITKIAIYPQWFDRSLRNLVRWCKMGLLTALTVKQFEFHKSKMADGRHLRTATSSYLSNLLTAVIKFGTEMHVGHQSLS